MRNKKAGFYSMRDMEISAIAGLWFSIGGWLLDPQNVSDARGLFGMFLFGAMLMRMLIFVIERCVPRYTTDNQYQSVNYNTGIEQLTLFLYQSGLVLDRKEGNHYWFRTNNLFLPQSYFLVNDHVKYCTILLQNKNRLLTDIKLVSLKEPVNYGDSNYTTS